MIFARRLLPDVGQIAVPSFWPPSASVAETVPYIPKTNVHSVLGLEEMETSVIVTRSIHERMTLDVDA